MSITPNIPGVGSSGMSGGKSKPTQNAALSFEQWLDHTQEITDAATEGPWEAGRGWVYTDPVYADDRRLSSVLGMPFADHGRQEEEVARGDRNAAFIAHARTALPLAVAALQAVLDLHQPRSTVTQSTSGHLVDTPGPCTACDWDWPCPTVTAINEALGDHQ